MRALLCGLALLASMASACSDDADTQAPTARAGATATRPTAGVTQTPAAGAPPVVELARQSLALRLGLPVSSVEIVSFARVEWPDGCLGLRQPDRVCTQVVTPGYVVTLRAQGRQFTYRTDLANTAMPD